MRFVMCTTLLLGLLRSLLFLMGFVSELGLKNFCFKSVRTVWAEVSSVVEGGTKKNLRQSLMFLSSDICHISLRIEAMT